MKIFITILISINLLCINIHADISRDKLYTYLDISVGGAMFLSYHSDTIIKFARKGLDKESLKKMLDDEKYLNLYTSDFIKLNNVYYDEIIKFYKTDVGKKYTKSMYNMSKIDKHEIKRLYSQNKCSNNKQMLIAKIRNELNLIDFKMEFAKKSFDNINTLQSNDLKKSIYEMEISKSTYKAKLIQREKIMSCIRYENFTLKELKEVYKYASTEVGKYEVKLMYEGFARYLKVFLEDIRSIQKNTKEDKR